MPRREPRDDDDRPRRRRKASSAGLLVGLGVGGAALLLLVVVAVILARGRRGGPADGPDPTPDGARAFGLPVKPAGKKTVGHFEEADDPAVVDRAWSKLVGTWREASGDPTGTVYEFFPDYRYRETAADADGRTRVFNNPVVMIRDDAGTFAAKSPECYSIEYHEVFADGRERHGIVTFSFFPDGTFDLVGRRYRRVK